MERPQPKYLKIVTQLHLIDLQEKVGAGSQQGGSYKSFYMVPPKKSFRARHKKLALLLPTHSLLWEVLCRIISIGAGTLPLSFSFTAPLPFLRLCVSMCVCVGKWEGESLLACAQSVSSSCELVCV